MNDTKYNLITKDLSNLKPQIIWNVSARTKICVPFLVYLVKYLCRTNR